MPEPQYLLVRNWDRWQPYKKRGRGWIRLYTYLLDDPDFLSLTETQQAQFLKLLLCYGRVAGPLPADCGYIARQLAASSNTIGKTLKALEDRNFIELHDRSVAKRLYQERQNVPLEERRGEENNPPKVPPKGDAPDLGLNGSVNKKPSKREIAEKMVQTWNQILPPLGLPAVVKLTDSRINACHARYREHLGEDLGQWNTLVYRIAASDFLTGKAERGPGHESWVCDFDFAVKSSSCVKILEGKYDNRQTTAAAAAANLRSDGL